MPALPDLGTSSYEIAADWHRWIGTSRGSIVKLLYHQICTRSSTGNDSNRFCTLVSSLNIGENVLRAGVSACGGLPYKLHRFRLRTRYGHYRRGLPAGIARSPRSRTLEIIGLVCRPAHDQPRPLFMTQGRPRSHGHDQQAEEPRETTCCLGGPECLVPTFFTCSKLPKARATAQHTQMWRPWLAAPLASPTLATSWIGCVGHDGRGRSTLGPVRAQLTKLLPADQESGLGISTRRRCPCRPCRPCL